MFRIRLALPIITMLVFMLGLSENHAQNPVILQAHIPMQLQRIPPDEIASFEAQFGVELRFYEDDTSLYLPSPAENLNGYLDALATYAQTADVLLVHSSTINPVGAKSGYLLNLAPLINVDLSLNPDEYNPAVWQAYQWDGGFWALPVSFDTVMIAYNPGAFDTAGLSHPNESWSYDDYLFAIEQLTLHDGNGNVTQAGFENGFAPYFFLSSLGNNQIFETWQNLVSEGSITRNQSLIAGQTETISIFPSSAIAQSNAQTAPLPNNVTGIEPTGFAVSTGTAYPELAYELVKFLSNQSAVLQNIGQSYPARNSLLDSNNLMTMPEMPYIAYALTTNTAPDAALLDMQNDQQLASERQNQPLTVNSPIIYGDGIRLRFGVHTMIAPMPNQALWEDAAMQFAEMDNEVAQVIIEPNFSASLIETTTNYDCFLMQQSDINDIDTALLLPISPLLAQDASFNPDDLIGSLWEQMQRNAEVYGYPITIMPRYLALDTLAFANAGLSNNPNWSISEFTLALEQLGGNAYQITNSLDLMVLLAAYDALPTTGDMSFMESADALAEILRLQEQGLLTYESLTAINNGMGASSASPIRHTAIGLDLPANQEGFELVNYPIGTEYSIASYRLGALYISRNTLYPEACYHWMRHLAGHPEIFQSMPSHRSQLNEQFRAYETLLSQPNLVVLPWIAPVGNNDNFALQYFYNEAADAIFLNNSDVQTALSLAQTKAATYRQCRSSGQAPQDCATGLLPIETVWR